MILNYMHDFFITEWSEMVFIPLEVLNKMAAWLTSQQAENGSFPEISDNIYARYFQVGCSIICKHIDHPYYFGLAVIHPSIRGA